MKKRKMLVSLLLALALVFSISGSAFAATPPSNVVNLFKKFPMIWEYMESPSNYTFILQRFLRNYNSDTNWWITYSGGVDGIFGPGTDAAIRAFQRSVFSNQLEWDGVAGPKTWEKICNNLDYRLIFKLFQFFKILFAK